MRYKSKNLLCAKTFLCVQPPVTYIVLLASANSSDFVELFCRIVSPPSPQVPQVVSGGRKTVSTPKFSRKKKSTFLPTRLELLRSYQVGTNYAVNFFF